MSPKTASAATAVNTAMVRPGRLLIPDGAWAVLFGVISITYFLLAIALGTSFFVHNDGPSVSAESVWSTVGIFALQAVPIVWRTRHPVASFWLVYAAFLAAVPIALDRNLSVTPTLFFAIFTVAAYTPRRTWSMVLGGAAIIDFVVHLGIGFIVTGSLEPEVILAILTRVIPTYLAPLLAGLLYGSQHRRAELAAEHASSLQAASDAQLAAAVAAERNRMARELHDVAAHHLSGILLQTKAAIRIRESDPATTGELLESINSEGELTLQSLREVVGVLRDDNVAVAAPTLSRLPELIASVRALHPEIEMTVDGEIDDLSAATSLACYRIIQESLTNARKHAPGAPTAIHVSRTARNVTVEVANAPSQGLSAGSPGRTGFGLLGMRERATTLGGTLDAGTTPGGGWTTRAVIPVERRVVA